MVQIPDERARFEIAIPVLERFDLLSKRFPNYVPIDLFCSAIYAHVNLFGDLLPRRKRVSEGHLGAAFSRLLFEVHGLARRIVLDSGRLPDPDLRESLVSFVSAFVTWLDDVHVPAMRAEVPSAREREVRDIWSVLSAEAESEGHFPPAQAKGAMHAALRRAGFESSDFAATITALQNMEQTGPAPAFTYLNSDGKQRVGERSVIDSYPLLSVLRTDTRRVQRRTKQHRQLRRLDLLGDIAARLGQSGLTESEDEGVAQREMLDVFMDVCAKRAELPCRPNATALLAVRAHLPELILGEITQVEVASRHGVGQPAVAKGLKCERDAVLATMRRRFAA